MKNLTVAIDPGLVTGVAYLYHSTDDVYTREVPGGLLGFVDWWEENIMTSAKYIPDQVFIEDWMVQPNTHRLTPQPDPYLIIGYTQGWCHLNGVPLMKIGPGEHKSFNGKGRKSKVRRIGWITETTPDGHAEDGASVLLTGMLRTDRDLIVPLLKEIGHD